MMKESNNNSNKFFNPPARPSWTEQIGERIRTLRKRLRLTQGQFSERLGRGNNMAVSRLERGDFTSLDMDLLGRLLSLASELGRDANWLIAGEEKKTERDPEWMASATKQQIITELVRLAKESTAVETLLRVVDDPVLRRAIAGSLTGENKS